MRSFSNFVKVLCTDFVITLSGMSLTLVIMFPLVHDQPFVYKLGLILVSSFEILKMTIFQKNWLSKFERGIINIMFVFAISVAIHPIYQPLFGFKLVQWPVIFFDLLFFQSIQAVITWRYFKN